MGGWGRRGGGSGPLDCEAGRVVVVVAEKGARR